jgi:hypothetical protein
MSESKKLNQMQAARVQRNCVIRGLASRPQGVSYKEIGYPVKSITEDVLKMVADGILHRRTPTGGAKCKGARFFTDPAMDNAYFAPVRNHVQSRSVVTGGSRGPAYLPGEPDLSNAKVTLAKPPGNSLRTNTHTAF